MCGNRTFYSFHTFCVLFRPCLWPSYGLWHYSNGQVLFFCYCWRIHFPPLEKFLANLCFIISVWPLLKLTFKYLEEFLAPDGDISLVTILCLRGSYLETVSLFFVHSDTEPPLSLDSVFANGVFLHMFSHSCNYVFPTVPHLCSLTVQRPWPVQNLFSQAHV